MMALENVSFLDDPPIKMVIQFGIFRLATFDYRTVLPFFWPQLCRPRIEKTQVVSFRSHHAEDPSLCGELWAWEKDGGARFGWLFFWWGTLSSKKGGFTRKTWSSIWHKTTMTGVRRWEFAGIIWDYYMITHDILIFGSRLFIAKQAAPQL